MSRAASTFFLPLLAAFGLLLAPSGARAAPSHCLRDAFLRATATEEPVPVSDEENARYGRLRRERPSGWDLFFKMENPILKEMNEILFGDKTLASAVTDRYKRVFLSKLRHELSALDGGASLDVAPYWDYKGLEMRFLFEEGPAGTRSRFNRESPELHAAIERAYRDTGKEIRRFVEEFPVDESSVGASRKRRGLLKSLSRAFKRAHNPEGWQLAGLGHTPEEANIAARAARSLHGGKRYSQAEVVHFEKAVPYIWKQLGEVESLRARIQDRFGVEGLSSGILVRAEPGSDRKVLSPEAIALLRSAKVSGVKPREAAAALSERFGLKFGIDVRSDDVNLVREYFRRADLFSPGLFFEKPAPIPYGAATHGSVSIDFTGLGAKNASATLSGLTRFRAPTEGGEISRELSQVLSRVGRQVDERVTRDMNRSKKSVEAEFRADEVHFSGDDGLILPSGELSRKDRLGIVRRLGRIGRPTDFRITFVPQKFRGGGEIAAEARSKLISTAESVEKELRTALEKRGYDPAMRDITLGVELVPESLTKADFNLYVAGTKETDPRLMNAIRESIADVLLKKASVPMAKHSGEKRPEYRFGTMLISQPEAGNP